MRERVIFGVCVVRVVVGPFLEPSQEGLHAKSKIVYYHTSFKFWDIIILFPAFFSLSILPIPLLFSKCRWVMLNIIHNFLV